MSYAHQKHYAALPWWRHPSMWRQRYIPSRVSRPTEDAALFRLSAQTHSLQRPFYQEALTPLERTIDDLAWVAYRRLGEASSQRERALWIVKRRLRDKHPLSLAQVLSILDTIDEVKCDMMRQEIHQQQAVSESLFLQLVREALAEMRRRIDAENAAYEREHAALENSNQIDSPEVKGGV